MVESNQLVSLQSQYTCRQLKVPSLSLSPEITGFDLMALLSLLEHFSSRSYRNIDELLLKILFVLKVQIKKS